VSARYKILFALCVALLAGLVSGFVWSVSVGYVVFVAALAGIIFGRITYNQNERSNETPSHEATAIEATTNATLNMSASALLEATMNGMREGVLVVDQTLAVAASNLAARRIFSRVEGRLENRRLSDLTRNAAVHAAFRATIEEGVRNEVKVELHSDAAERRVFDLSIVPLHLNAGKSPHGAIGVFFDITQLERLERVRQEFLSNVSHELRTPLTSIIAFVETLQDGAMEDTETANRFLSVIRRNAARMHNLIDDILELSAIEAGTVTIEGRSVRLHQLVADVASSLAATADARRINVRNEVDPEALVFADARRLEQMLTNLIGNAIKFNREGGSVIISHETNDTRDCIKVTDTGEGIPSEHLTRIFERFYRVDRARETGGTGLGLAIVKHLARAHGGEASADSKPGEGSAFTIELPAREQPITSAA
jgi:two-component system phosphate regulon sensor histidine kinase PhoR